MADEHKEKDKSQGGLAAAADLTHAITDPITKFGEGIAQTVYKVLSERSLPSLLLLLVGGTIATKAVIKEFRNALRDDPEGWAAMEDMLRQQDFMDNLEHSIKGVIKWHQERTAADRLKAAKPMKKAIANMKQAGFPNVAALFAGLGGVAGIEGLEEEGQPS